MTILNPYLTFLGNCEEAFNYYKSVFGGDFSYVGRFKEMPPQPGIALSAEEGEKIMHISLPISNEVTLFGSDSGGEWAPNTVVGNNITLSLTVDSRAENERLFTALSKGGKVTMPLADTFWGDYFGMCTDQFGINWMFSFRTADEK